ncbi:MAG: type 4b pilus protein PilO2 [Alphaproteobacteria bacterium]|nr:type 4b pilus protein PilO2 [Alphaproteobacteria bacterium]
MSAQVITVERKKYAVGLFWQPVADGNNARVFAQKMARLVPGRVKYFAEYRSMIGVGSRASGHIPGMSAVAAEAMDAFSEYNSFLAAFAVRQGIWVVAARNHIIIHDRLYAGEAAAKAEFDTLSELPDWGILVAPGSWSAARAEEKLLDEIVSKDSKYPLQPIRSLKNGLVSIIVLAAIIGGAAYMFREDVAKVLVPKKPAAKFNPAAAEAYKRKLEAGDNFLVPRPRGSAAADSVQLSMPYDELPNITQRAEQCWNAVSFLMQMIPGWTGVSAECDEEIASAHIHRAYGIITDVYDFVREKMPGVDIIENSDSDMVLTMPLDKLETSAQLEESGGEAVQREVNSIFQLMGMSVDVRQSVETVYGENGATGNVEGVNIVLVSAVSSLEPREFVKIFKDYDAVVLPKVRWSAAPRKWNYEVKIYVK